MSDYQAAKKRWGSMAIIRDDERAFDPMAYYPELPPANYTTQHAEMRFIVLELRQINESLRGVIESLKAQNAS